MRSFAPCLFAVAASLACAPARAGDLSVAAALGFESRYVFRGVQFAETSIQPSVTLTKDGFHVGAWFNLPVGDDDSVVPANGEELDLVIGYATPLGGVVTLDVGLTYYVFPEAMSGFGDFYEEDGDGLGINTLEPYVSLAFDAPLAPVGTHSVHELLREGVSRPPWELVLLLVAGFVLLIGPGDRLLVRLIRRHLWTWFSFPLWSLSCTVALVLISRHFLGGGDHRRSLTIHDLDQDGSVLRSVHRHASPARSDFVLDLAAQCRRCNNLSLCCYDPCFESAFRRHGPPAALTTIQMHLNGALFIGAQFIIQSSCDQLLGLVAMHWLSIRTALS